MEKYRMYAVLSCICVAFETLFELIIPMIMADIIDVGVAHGDQAYILERGLQMVFCAGISLVLGIGYARFAALCGQGLGAELRKAEYRKIQEFSFSNTDKFSTSSLVTRLTSDVTLIQNAVSNGIRPLIRAPLMMVTGMILSFLLNAKLALVFFVAAAYTWNLPLACNPKSQTTVYEDAVGNRPCKPDDSGKSDGNPCCEGICPGRL